MSAEIVRDVVEARAELYRAAGERAADTVEPAESVTPPSQPDPEQEREYRHLSPPQVRRSPRRAAIRATSHVRPIRHGHARPVTFLTIIPFTLTDFGASSKVQF